MSHFIHNVNWTSQVRIQNNVRPEVRCDFSAPVFRKSPVIRHSFVHTQYSICLARRFSRNKITQQCHVKMLLTKFHSYWSRNMENMGRNSLPALSKTWLTASRLHRSSLWVYNFFFNNSYSEFHENWTSTLFSEVRSPLRQERPNSNYCSLCKELHKTFRDCLNARSAFKRQNSVPRCCSVLTFMSPTASAIFCWTCLPACYLPACPPVFHHFQGPHYPRVMYYVAAPLSLLPPPCVRNHTRGR